MIGFSHVEQNSEKVERHAPEIFRSKTAVVQLFDCDIWGERRPVMQ
jgi:hypothetical protein